MKEENKVIVVDASVVLKWVLPEKEDSAQALELKSDFTDRKIRLQVPAHFLLELMNILERKFPSSSLSFLSLLLLSPIVQCYLSLELAFIATRLMRKYSKISFYDAFYHALAIDRRGTFVTADAKYYKIVKQEGHIRLLKDYLYEKL